LTVVFLIVLLDCCALLIDAQQLLASHKGEMAR